MVSSIIVQKISLADQQKPSRFIMAQPYCVLSKFLQFYSDLIKFAIGLKHVLFLFDVTNFSNNF